MRMVHAKLAAAQDWQVARDGQELFAETQGKRFEVKRAFTSPKLAAQLKIAGGKADVPTTEGAASSSQVLLPLSTLDETALFDADPATMAWLCQYAVHSKLHITRHADLHIPICYEGTQRELKGECSRGRGVAAALDSGRHVCLSCFRRLSLRLQKALVVPK